MFLVDVDLDILEVSFLALFQMFTTLMNELSQDARKVYGIRRDLATRTP